MSSNIDFYFDFTSPYGYFASTQINALASKYQRQVNWQPVLLGPMLQKTGGQPLMNIPLKGEYSMKDIERTARFYQIPYHQPSNLPILSVYPARAMLAIGNQTGHAKAIVFAQAAFKAFFVENRNIAEPNIVLDIVAELGLNVAEIREDMASHQLKEQFRAENEIAINRGVFGSPFVIIDGESFWGFDRMNQIEAWLKTGGF